MFLIGFSCQVCLGTIEQLRRQYLPGAPSREVGLKSYYLVNFFSEYCIKIKEIAAPRAPNWQSIRQS